MTNYTKQWSSASPGYLIFLVDQSSSMATQWTGEKTFAQFTADVINRTINELISANAAGESVKDRVFISLIGYSGSDTIVDIRSDYISKYADNPIRIDKLKKKVNDGAGGLIEMSFEMPIFLEPKSDGLTPMSGAFDLAKRLIEGWIQKKSDNPAPVIINVSDGYPQAGGDDGAQTESIRTKAVANEIMQIRTSDGSPLIFNVHIAAKGKEIQFPQSKFELGGDSLAELLFDISSLVPDVYKKAAKNLDLRTLSDGSKGFISNASPESLIKFINFGSSGGADRSSI
jgi:hypothetical protein